MNANKATVCPNCQKLSPSIVKIDPGFKLRLEDTGYTEPIPDQVCTKCYTELASFISQGTKLKAEQTAKETNRVVLWKSRVSLIKEARTRFESGALSEAAVAYEKYLRILEIVNDMKPGELTVQPFTIPANAKEITVIASVLWDLFRIYDSSPRYGDRQRKTAEKLAMFLEHSPTRDEILRQASETRKQAKNPEIYKHLLTLSNYKTSPCYIATATFESREAPEVQIFYRFRDRVLLSSKYGEALVKSYYLLSPKLARWVSKSARVKQISKFFLTRLAHHLSKKFNLQS